MVTKVDKKELVAEKPAVEKKKPGRQPSEGPTIASVAMAAIKARKDNKEVLALVKAQFPEAKTGMASINWYRNKAREEDPSLPTSRSIGAESRAKAKAAKAEEKAKEKAAKAEEKAKAKAEAAAKKKAEADAKKKAEAEAKAKKGGAVDPTA